MQNEPPELAMTIARIARSAAPVAPIDSPVRRLARWAVPSTLFALAAIALLGVRADLARQLLSPWFLLRGAATIALMIGAAAVALRMSVPGLEPPLRVRLLGLSGGLGWGALLLWAAAGVSPIRDLLSLAPPHPRCVTVMVTIALPAGVALLHLLRRAMPLRPHVTGAFAVAASLALGAVGSQLVCGIDAAPHHLLWHFVPLVVLALGTWPIAGLVLGRPRHG